MYPAHPTEQFVRAVLKEAGLKPASYEVCRVRCVDSSGLHRVYELVLSDGRTSLELVMPPAPMLRLLRSERRIINSEAIVVQWLTTILSANKEGVVDDPGSTQEDGVEEDDGVDGEDSETDEDEEDGEDEEEEEQTAEDVDGDPSTTNHGEGPRRRSSGTESQQDADRTSLLEDDLGLLHLLPKLVHQSSASTAEPGTSYALYQQRDRITISKLPTPLTNQHRAQIDYQLGVVTRRFSTFTSPTGRFGPAASIITSSDKGGSPRSSKDGSRSPSIPTSGPSVGSSSWFDAFHLMLEGILRDAEDMAIQVPYPAIRKHFARFSYALDEITEPQLVFMDGANHSNVLIAVEREPLNEKEREGEEEEEDEEAEDDADSEEESDSDGSSSGNEGNAQQQQSKAIDRGPNGPTSRYTLQRPVTISGLSDWSNALFGDPLIAPVFTTYPSPDFLQGYHNTYTPESMLLTPPYKNNDDVSPAEIRLLIYQVYHATGAIVKEFYRPKADSSTRELAARRRLTATLKKLSEIEDGPRGNRHRRPSGEMSPAKKLKADENWPSSSRKWEAASPLREWIDGEGGS